MEKQKQYLFDFFKDKKTIPYNYIPYNYRYAQKFVNADLDETFFEVNMPLLQSSKVPVLAYTKPISKLFSEPQ
jgi:hypothetical protein